LVASRCEGVRGYCRSVVVFVVVVLHGEEKNASMSKGDRNVRTLQKERRKTRHTQKGGGDAVVFYARRVLSANNKVVKKVAFVHDDYSLCVCDFVGVLGSGTKVRFLFYRAFR
jgi:hypothetical protein